MQLAQLVKRTGWVRKGIEGPESIADHMYRMGVMAMIVGDASVNADRRANSMSLDVASNQVQMQVSVKMQMQKAKQQQKDCKVVNPTGATSQVYATRACPRYCRRWAHVRRKLLLLIKEPHD